MIELVDPKGSISEDSLAGHKFAPTLATQELSVGFAPHADGRMLIESNLGSTTYRHLRVCIERRSVPGQTLARRVDEMAAAFERETGRKAGKKMRREMKDQALIDLLPSAFPRQAVVDVLIENDPDEPGMRALFGTTSGSTVDCIATFMASSLEGLGLSFQAVAKSPSEVLTTWLGHGAADHPMHLGRHAVLRADDLAHAGASVRIDNKSLDGDDVQLNLRAGMTCQKVELVILGSLSFILDDALRMHRIELLTEARPVTGEDAAEANLLLTAPELFGAAANIVEAMGGKPSGGDGNTAPDGAQQQ